MCQRCDELQREYEAAVTAKIAAGHEDDPDCDCDPCGLERNLWFTIQHAHDDAVLR